MHLTDIFMALVDMSVSAAWVALAVMAVRLALKKAPRWITVLLWALVAVRLLCPVTVESPVSLMRIDGAQDAVDDMLDSYVGPASAYWDIHEEYQMAVEAGIAPIHGGEGHFYVVTGETPTTKPSITADYVARWWVAGIVLMLAHALVSYWKLRKNVRASICLSENIYLCDYIDTPFILGVFRPRIYLPSSMDPDSAAHVLAHERAHLKRKDHWWKPFGFLLLAVHWFNPVLWLAYVLLCRDIEMACDEKVVREMDVPGKKAYSEALLRCSVSRRMIAACPLAFGEVGVKERVKTVLNHKKPAFWVVLLAVIALLLAAVCLLTDPVKNINGQRKFDIPGPNVADMDVQEVIENIRRYERLEDNENPYTNDYVGSIILHGNFDYEVVFIPYYYYKDGKVWCSQATFSDLAECCTLMGQFEWEEQESIYLLEHYLNALKYMPQEEIKEMLPDAEHYEIRFVEEGTPGNYDGVIRYSNRGVGATDGWLIHLEVIPCSHGEDGGFHYTGEPTVHLFYGDTPTDNRFILDAKILEISGKSYLVEPMPGSWELSSADKIWVQMELDADPMPQVGDIIRITYDGFLMETYPAQIGEVFSMTVVTGEYQTDMQSVSFIYRVDENGKIIGVSDCAIVENHVYFNDNLDKTATYKLTSEELAELVKLMEEAPEAAITPGAWREDYSQYVTLVDLKWRENNGDEWWVSLFYTDGGVNMKFYKELEDGTSELLDTTYHIRHEPLTEYLLSLCDRSRMENYINIVYPEGNYIGYSHGNGSILLRPQVGWEYETVPYSDERSHFGIRCRPTWVDAGWLYVSYWPDGFATCGTGLVTEDMGTYIRGYFDGNENWSFHRFTGLVGDYVVLNEGADSWFQHADSVFHMIDLDGPAKVEAEYVTYALNYANMAVPKLEGWEYEIEQWRLNETGNAHYAEIRFRPEGEEGWVALRYHEFLEVALKQVQVPTQSISKESWPEYEVNVSRAESEDPWLYIRYVLFRENGAFIPGTYIAWNEGADNWMIKEYNYRELMDILKAVRVADGILRVDEAVAIARTVSEETENMDFSVQYNTHTGEGIYRITFCDNPGENLWEVWVDNNGNIRKINGEDFSRTYQYEKEGFGGDFIIKLSGDCVAAYYEGPLSSYYGLGNWVQEGDIVTITDGTAKYIFQQEADALVFIEEGSSAFPYIDVADGERFYLQEG